MGGLLAALLWAPAGLATRELLRDDARLVLESDPELRGPRGEALRHLLYLFECDEAVRLFRAA